MWFCIQGNPGPCDFSSRERLTNVKRRQTEHRMQRAPHAFDLNSQLCTRLLDSILKRKIHVLAHYKHEEAHDDKTEMPLTGLVSQNTCKTFERYRILVGHERFWLGSGLPQPSSWGSQPSAYSQPSAQAFSLPVLQLSALLHTSPAPQGNQVRKSNTGTVIERRTSQQPVSPGAALTYRHCPASSKPLTR